MQTSKYAVVVNNVEVEKTRPDGSTWDTFLTGSDPDLFVCVGDDGALEKSTTVAKNLLEHTFDEALPITLRAGDLLDVTVCDQDMRLKTNALGHDDSVEDYDELIADCKLQIQAADIEKGSLEISFGPVEYLQLFLDTTPLEGAPDSGQTIAHSLKVGRVKVSEKKPDGTTWDLKGLITDLPDMVVRIRKITVKPVCTSIAGGTWKHNFKERLAVPVQAYDRIRVCVSDKDLITKDDLIGCTTFVATPDELAGLGKTLSFDSVTKLELEFSEMGEFAAGLPEPDADPRI